MALTPDPRNATLDRLNMLRTNRTIVVHALKRMVSNHSLDGDQSDSSCEDVNNRRDGEQMHARNMVTSMIKSETIDMETDDIDEDRKSQQQLKELEKDVNRVFSTEKQDDHTLPLSHKPQENEMHLCDSLTPTTSCNIPGLATPPRPRRATTSRTNSLESNGLGVAPGSPFQNNPLLVSHDYSKSPMLIDQDNEEEIAEEKAAAVDMHSEDEEKNNSIADQSVTNQAIPKPIKEDIKVDSSEGIEAEIVDQEKDNTVKIESAEEQQSLSISCIAPPIKDVNNYKIDVNEKDVLQKCKSDISGFDPKLVRLNSPHRFSPASLLSLLRNIEVDISDCRLILKEANERRKRHAIDDCRRSHDYDQFIAAFLSMLAERGHLGDLLEHGISVAKKKYQNANGSTSGGGNGADDSEGSSDNESTNKARKLKAKKALMKKKNKAKGIASTSATDNKQKSKGRGRPKKNK